MTKNKNKEKDGIQRLLDEVDVFIATKQIFGLL